jgi:hypothetical protein
MSSGFSSILQLVPRCRSVEPPVLSCLLGGEEFDKHYTASSPLVPNIRNHVPERRFNRAKASSANPNKSSSSVSKR